ncbi:hypothetical protein DM01DRAFT_1332305 [Hesseltinella vesiculosa]|uniref:Uncharacterized protein n=1 Tax=Hesseltinella vesiculosa TaxID=101127 RepID=A0A1X2GUQ3_9FUNG|nr:hypothetical protein DM01DRAFT_1332305 [Hesseltinella vesiculosa]
MLPSNLSFYRQSHGNNNEAYNDYLIELASHIDPGIDTDTSRFFQALPAFIQSTIIDTVTAQLESTDFLKAYQVLYAYIQTYPRHAYKYLIRAMKLLILGARGDDKERCINILVTNLLPRLWKQRLQLTFSGTPPSIRSSDGKHYIIIPCNLFEEFLRLGQRYYLDHRQWDEVVKLTCAMLDCCGYEGIAQLDFLSHTNRFQFLNEQRETLTLVDVDPTPSDKDDLTQPPPTRLKPLISATSVLTDGNRQTMTTLVAFMCEYMAVTSQFAQFAFEYYQAICVLQDSRSAADQEKACLIPICSITSPHRRLPTASTSSTPTSALDGSPSSDEPARKKTRLAAHHQDDHLLQSSCLAGVDQTLQLLSKAADCMRHLVHLWDWAQARAPGIDWPGLFGDWEQEFKRVIDSYQLPFDMYNAILLARSDLCLSTPSVSGNLSKALKLSQSICDRIETQRRQGKDMAQEYNIPFMFAFRVLYTIGVIYLLVGSLQQSTLEIAIILSVFPIPQDLDERDFIADQTDCHTAATVFRDHDFGLMHVTQKGLMVRCIKHLIVSLDSEIAQRGGMASIDAAMRWDEKAGSMIVLMQYGWPYWNTRTDFWDKIIRQMKERRTFKNRHILEYIFVPDILKTLLDLHDAKQVAMDLIAPEYLLQAPRPDPATPSSPSTSPRLTPSQDPHLLRPMATKPPPPIYEPAALLNTAVPSMTTMSPSWYAASTQNTSQANWMSPSFYYSRPATAVVLPSKKPAIIKDLDQNASDAHPLFIPVELVSKCLDQRHKRYSQTRCPPHRARIIIQRFLKNMVIKANEDS